MSRRWPDAISTSSTPLFLTNATAGFEIAYKMAGLRPGDEVIVPAITFIATIVYPLAIGAKVVLADVDRRTVNLDPADVARKITPRTRMIVPVHIGGWPVEMAPIMRLARQHDLVVLEDAAHAFGAVYRGRRAGTIGHFGAYSFHEVKNITALGEGGVLVSNTQVRPAVPQVPVRRPGPVDPDSQLALRRDGNRGHARAVRGRQPFGHRDPGRGPVQPDAADRPDHRRPAKRGRAAQRGGWPRCAACRARRWITAARGARITCTCSRSIRTWSGPTSRP